MNKPKIKVGFCVAYDWELLKNSIPRVYNAADTICLSIDKNRTSWSGKKYDFDESAFQGFIAQIDTQHKIKIYEDNFSLPDLSSIENDNRQRNMMADFLGKGGWHIQVDSDEYFLDFEGFVNYLTNHFPDPDTIKPINVCCNWVSLIKRTENGFLYVNNSSSQLETMPFATNFTVYKNARRSDSFNHISPFFVIHETWARGEEELENKLSSWGHDADFGNKESYLKLWKAIDVYNYQYISNFHPLKSTVWQKLGYCDGKNIEEFIVNLRTKKSLHLDSKSLFWINNRNWQRLKFLFNKD